MDRWIAIGGVVVPVWLLVVTLIAAVVVMVAVRRRGRLRRQFGRTLRGVGLVKGSIHPDQERLP